MPSWMSTGYVSASSTGIFKAEMEAGDNSAALEVPIDSDLKQLEGVQDLGDFYFVPRLDSREGDLHYASDTDVETLKAMCRENPDCVGFNTLGFLKREIGPAQDLKPSPYFSPTDGLYIFKERYQPSFTFFGTTTPKMVGSKPVIRGYDRPERPDMLILLPFFNFAHSYRTTQNLFYVRETLRSSGIPYLVVELAFKDEPFWIAPEENVLHLRAESRMFYKENLLQIGVDHSSSEYGKFCFLDADVLFSDREWYRVVSDLLETHPAVQPYANKYDLSAEFQIQGSMEYSTVFRKGTAGSPGLVWAVTREWMEQYGIFDRCVMGCGDRAFTYCFCGQNQLLENRGYRYLWRSFREYLAQGPERSAAFAPLTIFHMFHGRIVNRQYNSRDRLIIDFLSRHGLTDVSDILERRSDGLLEWREEHRSELNDTLGQYFIRKDDDGL